jgi:uncharacterized repeat protein (TIGR02543 family)
LSNSGTPVTAVADTGYYFLQWSDARTDNPRTDTNVSGDVTVTAEFAPNLYTLVYLADAPGIIDGPTSQYVYHGEDGEAVTVVPGTGYHFTGWDDGSYDNPRVDLDNTQSLTVSASFLINQYPLTYAAGPHGSIAGDLEQVVNHGECGSAVEALPNVGYHFVQWSDEELNALRVDCDNTDALSVTAEFAGNSYTVSFDVQGGTTPIPAAKMTTYGEPYEPLAITSRIGHTLDGWFTAPVGGTRITAKTRIARPEDHTVYARWTPRQYIVNFNSQGGTKQIPLSKTATYGQPYGTLPITLREGYVFEGWWTAPAEGTQVNADTLMLDTRLQHTLYAHWRRITTTFVYMAGENGDIDGDAEQEVPYGECGEPVTATPDMGYHFTQWDDEVFDNPRMDCYNTEAITVMASFAVNQYTLTYTPGDNGTLAGYVVQLVNHGDDGTSVTALPDDEYAFVSWSDGLTTNPRTDMNISGNITVQAVFRPLDHYVLHYSTGVHGSISGTNTQYVFQGENGTPVTAMPNTGCYFNKWSDNLPTSTRTDTNVTENKSVTALFYSSQYTLEYDAGENGCIYGLLLQTVNHGEDGSYIVALAAEGYHFSGWNDNWISPSGRYFPIRQDMNVVSDVDATALFSINRYAMAYMADSNGTISGAAQQFVDHGQDGTPVLAIPNAGYYFLNWNDGRTDNPRIDTNVQESNNVTAHFAYIFNAEFDLSMLLQEWMGFLRDEGDGSPLNTLAWFRDNPAAMYNHVLLQNWGTSYNAAALWTYAAFHELNEPLTIDCLGTFNLNIETQGMAIPDIVEFHILEIILKDLNHPLHASAMNAYLNNLQKWYDYNNLVANIAPGYSQVPNGIVYALAAYSTLDSTTPGLSANFYAIHMSRLYDVVMPKPPSGFFTLPESHHDADLDGDGFTNLEEYNYVESMLDFPLLSQCNGYKSNQDLSAILGTYASYINDKDLKPGPDEPDEDEEEPWSPCNCAQSEYSIILRTHQIGSQDYLPDDGRILLSPKKDKYKLGEKVQITFTPSYDTKFMYWQVDPASHIASSSNNESTYIYITDRTTITAHYVQRWHSLNVRAIWPDNLQDCPGTVEYEPGPHEYGSEVIVTAHPQEGRTTQWSRSHWSEWDEALLSGVQSTKLYIENNYISLMVRFPEINPDSGDGTTGTVNLSGGPAKILTSGGFCCCTWAGNHYHGCEATGPYVSNSARASYFCARCIPEPGFFLSYWHYNQNGTDMYFGKNDLEDVFITSNTTFTANLVPGISLNLSVEGQGVIKSDRFQSLYNPKLYQKAFYDDPYPILLEDTFSNRVDMKHQACPGWRFHHWEICNANGEWVTVMSGPNVPLAGDLVVWMNWFNPGNLLHVPEGQLKYSVKAVFEPINTSIRIISDSQFTFNNNSCTVSAQVEPSNGDYEWTLTPIEGSVLTLYSSSPNGANVVFTYTNLPTRNEVFGKKELTVTDICSGENSTKIVRIFFEETGTDHPEVTSMEGPDFYSVWPWDSSEARNWFYYWRQTSAGDVQPTPLYHYGSCGAWDAVKQQWCVYINQAANRDYEIVIGPDANLPENIRNTICWDSSGIDTFAWCCRHEAEHVEWYSQWRPNGEPVEFSSDDGDSNPDNWEREKGYNPDNADSNADTIQDCEDWVIRNQDVWVRHIDQGEDWANPGQQYVDEN